jgi:glycosyltransferase involved in cell wall biosynthesis
MKILIAAPGPWNTPIPYHIAPQRIARALTRAGHTVYNFDLYGDPYRTAGPPPNKPDIPFLTPWGVSMHSSYKKYFDNMRKTTDEFNPDLAYLFGILKFNLEMNLFSSRKIPVGFHQADPYWGRFPSKTDINYYNMMDFMTCNEGQAWNYLRQHGMKDKVRLLSHAIDPELAPTREEVVKTDKKYLCSMVMGGEDPYRKLEFLEYYYQWTDEFPEENFVSGGGTHHSMKWKMNKLGDRILNDASKPYSDEDLRPSKIMHSTIENVKKHSNRVFNVTKALDYNCKTMPTKENDAVLCHRFIHKLYSQSYYGFTPYGWYITHGPQSKYQVGPLGTKTTEMGGCGAAMIANWVNDIDILIQDGKTGFIFEKPEDARDAFQYAIDNPDDVRKMGLNAYDHIHRYHSWDVRYRDVLVPIFRELGLI